MKSCLVSTGMSGYQVKLADARTQTKQDLSMQWLAELAKEGYKS